ncbi:MAG: glycosyltransferase, partial [Pseudomonadota bacterium]
ARVDAVSENAPLPVAYVHCPAGNISIARNAALDACQGRYAAFIDDDEIAEPGWLAALLQMATETRAQVVLGPVEARYGEDTPSWMRRAALHDTNPVEVGGEIRTGYTCNVLIDRTRPTIRALRFDPSLGRSGGEDTDYFSAIHRIGGTFALAQRARVYEHVPRARASFRWLAQRRFRMGQTHARILRTHDGKPRLTSGLLAAAKIVACAGLAVAGAMDAARRNRALLRACFHMGVVSGLAGGRMNETYGIPAAGTP